MQQTGLAQIHAKALLSKPMESDQGPIKLHQQHQQDSFDDRQNDAYLKKILAWK